MNSRLELRWVVYRGDNNRVLQYRGDGRWHDVRQIDYQEARREDEARATWERYCASGKKPADIPDRPDLVYAAEWKGWVDWLGEHKIDD